ncbi:MAG: uL15 family ribosomal protein [Candidatus Pacebacteria bacterium]|nr:uL15 family ribosomal protein [Candidatus Paceibacterota bacterium]
MQLHELKKNTTFKKKKRVGRGGKKGTYCGTGGKGQKGRAGAKFKPLIREWVKKYPKLRGYNFNVLSSVSAVNLDVLEKTFNEKDVVSPETLVLKKAVRRVDGKAPLVKILSRGEIKKALVIESCAVSKAAKEKIEKAGGTVKEKVKK